MKKILLLIPCGLLFMGCYVATVGPMLRVNYKLEDEDSKYYYLDEEGLGHNENVSYSVVNDTLSTVEIPVKYDVKADPIPKKLPEVLESYRQSFEGVGICLDDCALSEEKLTLNVHTGDEWKNAEKSFLLYNQVNNWNKGIIVKWQAKPDHLVWTCNSKSCAVCDEKGNIVNEILISKNLKVNPKEINQLLVQERKEEAKQKAEEAKRKAEEDRKWRQKQRQQKKECPNLYRTLYWAQQTGYIDPIIGMKTAQRFDELDCGFWLNQQMY